MTRSSLVAASLALLLLVPGPAAAAVSAEWASRWRADLAFLADTLPRVHANLFHTLPRDRFEAELDSLGARLPRLDHHQIAIDLARIIARVGDGHTRLTLPFDSAAGFFTGHSSTAPPRVPGLVLRQLPVRLRIFADGVHVVRAGRPQRELLGGRVVSIGRLPIEAAMAAVEPTVQRDNAQQVLDLLPIHLVVPEILHARGVVEDLERVRLVIERPSGERHEAWLAPAPPGVAPEWVDARDPGEPPLADRRPAERHWFQRIDGTSVLYARYREVLDDGGQTVAAFAESLFGALERGGADRLVLDLRGNPGGDGFLNRPVLRGIIATRQLRRPGALFVVADRGTFSAAMMLLADLESMTPAVIVGETSGARPNGYGDSRRIRLPNTGLTVRASTLYWQMTDPRDRRDGIDPLVAVETRFADWKARRDPVLDSTLALLRTASDPSGEWSGSVAVGHERVPITIAVASRGGAWTVRLTIPALGIQDEPASDVRFAGGRLTFARRGEGPAWEFDAHVAPGAIVGVARYRGADLPFVLRRRP